MPDGVSVILMGRDGVLLVQRAKSPFKEIWSFPGGAREPGEAPESAARRELGEETGLEAGELIGIGTHIVGDRSNAMALAVFAGALPKEAPVAASDAAKAVVVPLERVLTYPLTPHAPSWIVRAIDVVFRRDKR